MNEGQTLESKVTQSVCAQCGSRLSATDGADEICINCLLRSALDQDDVDPCKRPQQSDHEVIAGDNRMPIEFGDYELLEEIGRGSQGVVYRARQKSLNRIVALKVIALGHWATEPHVKRFRREAEAAARLNHPCIVPIYEVGERDGACYFSMGLVEGGQLDAILEREPMAMRSAVELIVKLARTVQYAHEHNILHRDIKPGNILLDEKGEPHLTDFGLARLVETESTVTRTREVLGTPSYMAPEQAAGETTKLGKATDVYGLGAVLYQLLTGHPPFAGGTTYETIRLLLNTEPRKPRALNHKIDRDLSTICLKCLEKEAQRRYSSAFDLAEDLEHWLKHEPVRAKPSGVFTRACKSVRRNPSTTVLVMCLVALAVGLTVTVWNRKPPVLIPKSVAVLPFENLSDDPNSAYFAEGIQEEILTRLASVADLKVISRTSTAKYPSKPDNLKTVAQELGVSTILEGTVQKASDQVRVNVQLIDARSATHLWAKSYDREFKDVLEVESDVPQEIVDALQANLSPSESHVLAAVRTHDAEAYDLFLRGQYAFHQAQNDGVVGAYDRAEAFYRQALARDPNFAEAAAELARSRLWQHWEGPPLASAELEEVKSIIDRALALAPNSPEAHLALGAFFYWGHRQYEMALTEFNRTLELQPNNAWARLYCSLVYRRRGEWERSLADSQQAQELDPRDAQIPAEIGSTYVALRLWRGAERAELRALAIDPHNTTAALFLVIARLNSTGDVGSARRTFDGFTEDIKSSLNLLEPVSISQGGDLFTDIIEIPVYLDVMERHFTDAFQALEKEVANDELEHTEQLAGRAAIRVLAGQTEAAKSAGEEALPLLEARLRARPDDTFAMTELSWVYLALGRNADALRLSRQTADSISIEKDAMAGPSFQLALAQIEARAGAPEEAIKRLRRLLSIPTGRNVSTALLKIDPVWDLIRNRPDFQQLLSGPEQIGPNK